MRIGILGTGIVGQTLGLKLVQLGHAVKLGTRDPTRIDEPKGHDRSVGTLRDWLARAGPEAGVGSFCDAAEYGELLLNALSGRASLEVLRAVPAEHLSGKTLMDVSNPVDASHGFPLTLFVKDTDSLAEILQRALPDVRIVKTLNTMTAALMVNPELVGDGEHTVFICGNDAVAKAQVAGLLREFGWRDIVDLGDITGARGVEMLFTLGHAVMRVLGPAEIAFKVVR